MTAGDGPVVQFDDVSFAYRHGPPWHRRVTPALRNVAISIQPGETIGLVGESGSGKSTLGLISVGLLKPDAGHYRFDGGALTRRNHRRGAVQAVFQQPDSALNPRLRIGTSIAEPLKVAGTARRDERRRSVEAMLEQVGLDPSFATRYPHELSGGQRQRVAVARALITHPRFVLFDEVVTALDVSVQTQVLNLLLDLQREHGFGALFISHDVAVVRYVADHVGVLRHGRLVELAPAERFYGTPEHEYSRELCAAIDRT